MKVKHTTKSNAQNMFLIYHHDCDQTVLSNSVCNYLQIYSSKLNRGTQHIKHGAILDKAQVLYTHPLEWVNLESYVESYQTEIDSYGNISF